jgi:GIY-YIG catalytic domain
MDRVRRGGWVYIMADRYRGTLYVGVTSDLAARIFQHREGTGSDFARARACTVSSGPKAATILNYLSLTRNDSNADGANGSLP